MAKRASNPDAALERLTLLRQMSSSPEFHAEVRSAIAHKSVVVCARGAELAARYEKKELVPDLIAAYRRFAGTTDRDGDGNYVARTAIVRSLVDLYAGGEAADVYLQAVKVVAAAPPGVMIADPAAELRSTAAFGLIAMVHPSALMVCTDLLADSAVMVRIAAARALGSSGREGAALVLRLKLQLGDPDPEVLAECVTSIMQIMPKESLDVAKRLLLHRDEGVRASAALAIGTSKLPEALETLRQSFGRERDADVCKTILIAAASTRAVAAIDWLVSLVEKDAKTAVAAIEALGPYRLDDSVRARVGKVVAERKLPALDDAMKRAF